MTARTLDAAALAARMNRRPLGPDCDGGEWTAFVLDVRWTCDVCNRTMRAGADGVASDVYQVCLPCAVKDCDHAEHAASDPHCTCNDCMADHIAAQSATVSK